MKKSLDTWTLVLIALCTYSAIETPLALIWPQLNNPMTMGLNGLVSLVLLFDCYRTWKCHQEEMGSEAVLLTKKKKHFKINWTLTSALVSSLPYELLYFIPGSPMALGLLKLLRLSQFMKTYKKISLGVAEERRFRLPLILTFALIGVHLVACSWLALNPTPDMTPSASYVRALYWAITTLTTTGYGDITPTTDAGRIFTIFVMITGFSVFGLIVGNISNILMARNRHSEANKEKMEDMALFMQHYQIPYNLRHQINNFHQHQMNKRLSENDDRIVADLPHALQNEVFIYMKIKLISGLPVFHGLSTECLHKVSHAMEQVSFSAGASIMNKGDHGEEMYIIDHGEVNVVNDEGNIVAMLKHGQCIGEIALLKETTRTATVKAASYCDLYRFKKEDFLFISKTHPELETNFRKIMEKRLTTLRVA